MPLFYIKYFLVLLVFAAFGLAGCGGGGGTGQTPFTPTPVPAPAPAPTPAPSPTLNFDTAEYNRQTSLAQISALEAYEAGATGRNVVVTVIDSGIDLDNPEFEGRIHAQSADLVISSVVGSADARDGGPELQDSDDHGTPVAGIIAANKNDSGVHGVAPFATLLIYRADDDGTEDILYGNAIQEGVNRSVSLADVINMSFGSDEADARGDFRQYLTSAKNADIVTVLAAGNDGEATPDLSALGALDVPGAPAAIVAGAVGQFNTISSFSNRAGDAVEIYLVAPGESIRGVTISSSTPGQTRSFSGTSAATPHIAGAAALLRSLWPDLTATEVVEILLTSATDLGAPGTDPIYGRGLLNVGAATQPIGGVTTSSVDGDSIDASTLGGDLSDAYGTSFASLNEIIVFDAYNRDFKKPLNTTISHATPIGFNIEGSFSPFNDHQFASKRLNDRVAMHFQMTTQDQSKHSFSNNQIALALDGNAQKGLVHEKLAVATQAGISENLSLFAAQGFSGHAVDRMTLSTRQTPFLSHEVFTDAFLPKSDNAVTAQMRMKLSRHLSLDLTASMGENDRYADTETLFDTLDNTPPPSVSVARAGLSYEGQDTTLRIEQGLRHERGAVLGAKFSDNNQATTIYSAFEGIWRPASLWQLQGRLSVGLTQSDASLFSQFTNDGLSLVTTQASFAVKRQKLFGDHDSLWLGISQPMQIEHGGVEMLLPTAFDQSTHSLTFTPTRTSLAAAKRRLDIEASYRLLSAEFGAIDINVIHQTFGDFEISSQTTALVRSKFSF